MVSLETNHTGNIVRIAGPSRRPGLIQRAAYAGNRLFTVILRRLAERSKRRLEHARSIMIERSRQRRALASMSVRDLKDIGIASYDVEIELRKPFWR
jgi:uncharacterized protein YjiS (DUF1127 family)